MFEDHIPKSLWKERDDWFFLVEESSRTGLVYFLSELATIIICDIRHAFCAGAWISVIVLAHAAVDATIRETESGDYKSNSKKVFENDPDLEWLRLLRNKLVHVSPNAPEPPLPQISMSEIDIFHNALEVHARKAIEILFRVVYANPGI